MKFRPVLPRRFLGVCGRKHSRLRVQTRARAVVRPMRLWPTSRSRRRGKQDLAQPIDPRIPLSLEPLVA